MPPSSKPANAHGARRKSSNTKQSLIIQLKLSPTTLRAFDPLPLKEVVEKEDSPVKESPSSSNSNTLPATTSSNGDNKSDSNVDTPVAVGTPVPSAMPPPPIEGPKKKGTKRSAAVALGPDGLPIPKVRGKPGPKKKARLEDGTIDHSSSAPRAANGTAHKLGPKANQGAINAGLRALDRTGKPCRKWQKGGFVLKSFTGVVWEIPRWKAPPRYKGDGLPESSASGDSSKENKDSQVESEKSNVGIEAASSPVPSLAAPAPSAPLDATPTPPASQTVTEPMEGVAITA
ncbi:hypothetical protein HYFRA_00008521 [Hymenoscyphus fraxineus]|uniref:DUF1711-domain-containing protein n=1 Tax=Hymenoscyphus fraxineus TaxID=746836 RepID=A0A9N9KW04_9HELO|nr:hypothetical protein HYFRA_00008521 [Hymenoscyphus fraxineus]